jgi:hypothetical protein
MDRQKPTFWRHLLFPTSGQKKRKCYLEMKRNKAVLAYLKVPPWNTLAGTQETTRTLLLECSHTKISTRTSRIRSYSVETGLVNSTTVLLTSRIYHQMQLTYCLLFLSQSFTWPDIFRTYGSVIKGFTVHNTAVYNMLMVCKELHSYYK